ncbi:hypothetical protein KFL_004240060 [Klebsormidium nitens]|uniref:TF-B3 domain-containing protein n=1 Tax=Klebsormidium nitens TaxID=105231 RepID=A0A1Y1IBQ0_KLENI|nr:hypothetical protein KFL_004240060 [Klebsormidium nitens]|eukprot:GAQ88394.1 hypothetical protein KFL_004240060 [Klebsormidium nitens]
MGWIHRGPLHFYIKAPASSMAKLSKIELERQERIKENERHLQDFGIVDAADALAASRAKPQAPRRRSSLGAHGVDGIVEIRRSGRVQNMPAVSYKDLEERNDHLRLTRGPGRRSAGPYRPRSGTSTCSDEARDEAEARANAIKVEGPAFVKRLLQSMISGGFWLQWPNDWCVVHMPSHDVWVTLLDADGEAWECKYLGGKKGLSAGWRGYSIHKGFDDGDALAFEVLDKNLDRAFCDAHLSPDERAVLLEGPAGGEWEAVYKPVRGALSGGWRAFAIDHGLDDGDAAKFEVVDKHLQAHFCQHHLPGDRDGLLILEDEHGESWEVMYKPSRAGLSGGWGGFAKDHDLGDGDCCVFEVIEPRGEEKWRVKVHIVRADRDGTAALEGEEGEGDEVQIDDGEEEVIPVSADSDQGGAALVKEPSIDSPPKKRKREPKVSMSETVKAQPAAKKGKSKRAIGKAQDNGLTQCAVDFVRGRRVSPEGVVSFLLKVKGVPKPVWVEDGQVSGDSAHCWLSGEEEEEDS